MIKKVLKFALVESVLIGTIYAFKNYNKIMEVFIEKCSTKNDSEINTTDSETTANPQEGNTAYPTIVSEVVIKKPARKTAVKKSLAKPNSESNVKAIKEPKSTPKAKASSKVATASAKAKTATKKKVAVAKAADKSE